MRRLSMFRVAASALVSMSLAFPNAVLAQQANPAGFVINLRAVEIQALAEQVSGITGRTLILDPNVRAQVTVVSSEPLDAEGVWELFQSVLRVNRFAVLPSGDVWRVVPQDVVNQGARIDRQGNAGSQELVTRMLRLRNLPADVAVRVLRPLVATFGYLEAVPRPNAIVITDYSDNVRRVEELALALDQGDGGAFDTIRLNNAGVRDVAQAIERLVIDPQNNANGLAPRIAVDERSNTMLVRGDPAAIAAIRRLAADLDTPGGTAPTTRLFRLNHSDAESVTDILRGVIGAPGEVRNPVARSLAAGGAAAAPPMAGAILGNLLNNLPAAAPPAPNAANTGSEAANTSGASLAGVTIQPAPDLNGIVVRGAPAAIAEIGALIAELDVRRPQVMIEAAIVEITSDTAEQLGVQLGLGDSIPPGGFGATSFTMTGLSLRNILGILGVPGAIRVNAEGLSAGVRAGDDFGILVQALSQSSKANLLSTPSLTTLDNQPAEIVVGQNVPFRTGSFTTQGNSTNPFTTIEREDVGITMRVVPRVHQGDVIRLEVSQEVSSLVNANVPGAADLITNRRSIQTTVLADDGATVVLGGLMTDDRLSADSQVPIVGDIPLIGPLFGAERQAATKRTLFVFLRPTILRDRADLVSAAQEKYQRLRNAEGAGDGAFGGLLLESPVPKLPLEIEGIY